MHYAVVNQSKMAFFLATLDFFFTIVGSPNSQNNPRKTNSKNTDQEWLKIQIRAKQNAKMARNG